MSSRKGTKKKSTERYQNLPSRRKRKQYRLWWLTLGMAIVAVLILAAAKNNFSKYRSGDRAAESSVEKPDFQSLVGDWVRPDGGYVIKIRSIDKNGGLEAGYFNPRAINVSRAVATAKRGKINVFIKLQDRGYPGSTYTLVYHDQNDALVGTYYQAAMGRSFDVAFMRN